MNTLETNAPLGQVYELQSTTQGTLLAEVVSSPGTSGNTFTDSVSTTGSTFDPLVAPLTNAPPAFVGLVVTGYVSVSWTNNESADAVGNVVVTFEVSLDSGVTFNSIGDPVIASAFNPSTASWFPSSSARLRAPQRVTSSVERASSTRARKRRSRASR